MWSRILDTIAGGKSANVAIVLVDEMGNKIENTLLTRSVSQSVHDQRLRIATVPGRSQRQSTINTSLGRNKSEDGDIARCRLVDR